MEYNHQIDSLEKIVNSSKKYSEKFEAYKQLVKIGIIQTDTALSRVYVYKLLHLAESKKIKTDIAHAYLKLSKFFYYSPHKDSMSLYLEKSRKIFIEKNDKEGIEECEYIDMFNLFKKHEEDQHDSLFALAEKARIRFKRKKEFNELRKVHDCYFVFYINHTSDTSSQYAIKHAKLAVDYAYKTNNNDYILKQLYRLRIPYAMNRMYAQDYETALEILDRSKNTNDELIIARANLSVANALRNFDPSEEIEKTILECIKVGKKLGNNSFLASCYSSLARYYGHESIGEKAVECYKENIKYLRLIGDIRSSAISLGNLGEYYLDMNELDSAKKYQDMALKIRMDMGITEGIMYSYKSLGNIYIAENNFKKAVEYGEKAMDISKKKFFNNYDDQIHHLLFEGYQGLNNYKKALTHYIAAKEIADSVLTAEKQKELVELKLNYDLKQKEEIEILARQKEELAIQKDKEKQKVVTISLIIGLILLVAFFGVLLKAFIAKRNNNKILESKNIEITAQKEKVEEAHEILEEKNQEILDSINYAKRIQNAILPPLKLVKEYLPQSFILYTPKDIVAGDFYWIEHKNDVILFAAADCTGHGVPGAMVSVVCNNGLNRSVREHGLTDPGKILDKTKEIVIQEFDKSEDDVKDGMDISLCSLKLSESYARLQWAGANNPLWIIRPIHSEMEANSLNNGFELLEYKGDKQPIGKYSTEESFTTHSIELQKGDSIYVFTDGFADQFGGEKRKKLMYKPFKELLLSIQESNMDEQKEILEKYFESWKGTLEQVDDVCVIGVRI